MKKEFDIAVLSTELKATLQDKIDNKTKPLGSLGQLEHIALQLGCIQNSLHPEIKRPAMIVFAADHGVVKQGVSAFPQEVTQQMLANFVAGGAAVSVFCQQHEVSLRVVDVGVKGAVMPSVVASHLFADRKVANGTEDFSQTSAMTSQQYEQAIQAGIDEVDAIRETGTNLVMFGEMGIGNTTTAASLMACLTGLPPEQCVGPGTGLTSAGVNHKAHIVALTQQRIEKRFTNNLLKDLPAGTLAQECGGFEIVAMAGAMLRAAECHMAFVVDGFICSAALLLATKINDKVKQFAIFAHESHETAHKLLLDYLAVKPLLTLNLRLGEGSGAILAFPIIQSAVSFLNNMASFESAAVSNKSD
ncbi:nicotinate-nucleotide--dimethylbenzimidazole phosphoribosyltransferase [Marinomonas agarivorans]|nr:nicotinate-nucleotide--dimethylbenzimidazole phosphoribosyltransferase [Marinomonas agarivorans]